MKNTKIIISLCTLLWLSLFANGCHNKSQNFKTYCSKLTTLVNRNTKDIQAMNDAMTSGNYEKAEKVRKKWENHLKHAVKKVKGMSVVTGSSGLKRNIIEGLAIYKKTVSNEYKQLIEIRRKGGSAQKPEENRLLERIAKAFTRAGEAIDQVTSTFSLNYKLPEKDFKHGLAQP